jgi:hypothetical protein
LRFQVKMYSRNLARVPGNCLLLYLKYKTGLPQRKFFKIQDSLDIYQRFLLFSMILWYYLSDFLRRGE